jgi:hypothetical protein
MKAVIWLLLISVLPAAGQLDTSNFASAELTSALCNDSIDCGATIAKGVVTVKVKTVDGREVESGYRLTAAEIAAYNSGNAAAKKEVFTSAAAKLAKAIYIRMQAELPENKIPEAIGSLSIDVKDLP